MRFFLACLFLFFCLSGCKTHLKDQPAFSANKQLQAVIETPAGAAHPYRYNPGNNEFERVQEAGQDKVIRFLPYPVNAGFIPSTHQDTSRTGQLEPLPVLVICESRPSGTLLEIMPVGVMVLEIEGNLSYQLVAVPAKPSEQLLSASDYAAFSGKYPDIKKILELWLVKTNPNVKMRVMGWKDDKFADDLVRKWLK